MQLNKNKVFGYEGQSLMKDKNVPLLFQAQNIAKAMSAHLHTIPQKPIQGFATDTRQNCKQKLFFPFEGPHFDGHDYLEAAVRAGASAVVCQKDRKIPKDLPQSVGVFYVNDSLRAYQDLARHFRQTLKPKVVAITGSNGKTTTKEFLATLLSSAFKPLVSKASFNNHIGVPHTLLQIKPETQVVVIEMGMNHLGEIKELVSLSDPNIVLVTTVGKAHLEALQTIENIATAKEEIYKYSKKEVIKIFNLDNLWTQRMYDHYHLHSPTFTFSAYNNKKANVCFQAEKSGLGHLKFSGNIQDIRGQVTCPIFGEHHLYNLMAASCAGLALGLSPQHIWQGLPKCKGAWGRSQVVTLKNRAKIIFDAYNANPDSMQALLAHIVKCQISGNLHICLGDMLELGDQSEMFHKALGQSVAQIILASNIKAGVIAFIGRFGKAFQKGLEAKGVQKSVVLLNQYKSSLASDLQSHLQPEDVVIVKASRGMQLEKLLEDLLLSYPYFDSSTF